MKLKILLFILILNSSFCLAQFQQICSELGIKIDSVAMELLTYKNNYKSQKLFLIPIVTEKEEGAWEGDLYIVKYDTLIRKIIAETRFKNLLSSDAIEIREMWIDTATYIIKNGVTAFGIKIRYESNSRAAGAEVEDIILIKEDDGKFYNILKTTTKRSVSYGGGNCEQNEGFNVYSYLIIDKKNVTNQHYNIIEKLESEYYTVTEDCKEGEPTSKRFVNVYKFQNGRYNCENRHTGD